MENGVVIVGGGQAGLEAAAALRSQGYAGPIALICEEPHAPYQRPPLSKDFLAGKQEAEHLPLRALTYYETHQIDLILGDSVTKIDAAGKSVRLASNRDITYDHLVLAVGARNRPLPVAGAERALYLRTVGEAQALRERLSDSTLDGLKQADSNSVVVIGGGFIGLEVAAAARAYGKTVTVIESLPRLMARAVPSVISDFFLNLHSSRDVNVVLNSAVVEIQKNAVVISRKEAGNSEIIPADLVVAGIGVIPNTELAREAGLAVGNGIVVDEYLRTSDQNIFAIGDCAEHPNPFSESRARLESVQNAVDQAKNIARTILGSPTPYREVPWFWTDQFEVRFQMAGLSAGHDQPVIRGDIASNKFSVFYFKQGRLLAADSVNRFGDHIAARKLLAHELHTGTSLLTPEHAADETVDLKKLMLATKV